MARPPHLVIVQDNREPQRLPLVRDLALGRDPEVAIAINSVITENGVLEPVEDGDEIFLLPAIAGG